MELLETVVLVVHVLVSVALVGLVLLQQGKGADAGAAFGGGASQTVFGSQGSGSFLTRFTAFLAFVFKLSVLVAKADDSSESFVLILLFC